jgi:hypothetical protein
MVVLFSESPGNEGFVSGKLENLESSFGSKLARIFGLLFYAESCVLILAKKWVGPHFGRFLYKLIWSPCLLA